MELFYINKIRELEQKIANLEAKAKSVDEEIHSLKTELEDLKTLALPNQPSSTPLQTTPAEDIPEETVQENTYVEEIQPEKTPAEDIELEKASQPTQEETTEQMTPPPIPPQWKPKEKTPDSKPQKAPLPKTQKQTPTFTANPKAESKKEPFNIENYIGGNVLSKLGISILIIGVGVFVKYAIDRDLISPLGRLILAYSAGAILIGLSYYLKKKYHGYSAVLFSGGAATVYFSTYIGYIFLQLIPQELAYPFMILTTIYTVFQSTRFDEEIIGIIGLVGAYAIPPLIGNRGGNIAVFFTYMSIINIGVLILAFRKNWTRMSLMAYWVSWLIFVGWTFISFKAHLFTIGIVFAFVFFIIFQVTLMFHYLHQKGAAKRQRAILLVVNAIIFYLAATTILQFENPEFVQNDIVGGFQTINWGQGWFSLVFSLLCLTTGGYAFYQDRNDEFAWERFLTIGIVTLVLGTYLILQGVWIPIVWAAETALIFALWQSPTFKNWVLDLAHQVMPYLVAFIIPFVFEQEAILVSWIIEAALLFATAKAWKSEAYNNAVLVLCGVIAIGVAGIVSTSVALIWWSVELVVIFTIARIWHDVYYDYMTVGVFVLVALGIGYYLEGQEKNVGWAIETLLVFALSRVFTKQKKLYDGLSALLAIVLGGGIFALNEGVTVVWWWLLESLVLLALARIFDSHYLEYVNYLLIFSAIVTLFDEWQSVYVLSKDTIGFINNPVFYASFAVVLEILGIGVLHSKFKEKAHEISGLPPQQALHYVFDLVGGILLYSLLFLEIYHYFIAQNPINYHLMSISLILYSCAYVIAWQGVNFTLMPLKNLGYILLVLTVLFGVTLVTLGYWHLDLLHFKKNYIWVRWGAYALGALMMVLMYRLIKRFQLLDNQQLKTWFVFIHVTVIVTLSFELVSLVMLYAGLNLEKTRMQVFKLGFTLLWSLYSVGLIAYGIARRFKYLRLTGFAFLAITLVKLFIHDISYNSTLNVIVAFISLGVLLLLTAFLYQKYKHVILGEDEVSE